MVKIINTSGKRKTAIARATLKAGKGVIRVNSVPLETYGSDTTRMKIAEPILLIPNAIHGIDVIIDVAGGGVMGQAEAVRTASACPMTPPPSTLIVTSMSWMALGTRRIGSAIFIRVVSEP